MDIVDKLKRDRRERLGEFLGGLVQDRDELVNYTPPNRTTLLGDRSQTPASVQFVQDYGDFLPVVGDIAGVAEVGQELSKDDPNYPLAAALGLATAVGAVPVVGDTVARGVVAGAERLADAVPSDVKYATRSLLEGDLGGVREAFYEGGVPVGVGADAVNAAGPAMSYDDLEVLDMRDFVGATFSPALADLTKTGGFYEGILSTIVTDGYLFMLCSISQTLLITS